MDVRQLKYFAAVADTLNFSRAAESLFVSQSALSKQIAELEKELGVVLLKRDKRSVELTSAGKIFVNEAKAVLVRLETIPILVKHSENADVEAIHLHIGVEERVGDSPIFHLGVAEAIQQLRQEVSGLRVAFKLRDYLDMNKEIKEGELDMGIFMGTKEDVNQEMRYRVLFEDEMVLVYRGPLPEGSGEAAIRHVLSEYPLFLMDQEFRGMSQIIRILGASGLSPDIRFCASTLDMTLIAESGEGCAIIPLSMGKRLQNDKLQFLRFMRPEAKIYFMAMWRKEGDHHLAERIALRASLNIEVMR